MKRSQFVESTIGLALNNVAKQTFTLRGQRLTSSNLAVVRDGITAWLFLSLDLGYESRLHDYNLSCELLDTLDTLSECWDLILQEPTVSNFKGWLRKESRFKILYPCLNDILCFLRTKDGEVLGRVFCWCNFLKKLPLKMPDLEASMWNDWLDNESRLAHHFTDPQLLSDINSIIIEWLSDFSVDLKPRHGLGSVAEGNLSKSDKYLHLHRDKKLEIVACPCNHDLIESYFPLGSNGPLRRTSRLIFVPKTYKKLRTVCPEPATLQYFQQPVMNSLYSYIRRHPYLHDRIPIENQTVNRIGARIGSVTQSYCTIDLSAASDSVIWSNAKQMFHNTPLYRWMVATRSDSVYYPTLDTTVQVCKYAPMGSALCFPVECIIFAAVCEYVGRRSHCDTDWIPHYSVYGDDIVCPTCWFPAVELVLSQLGFIVNKEKSFTTGCFRESCGAEYYNGILLPHLHYKVPSSSSKTAIVLDPLVNLANRADEWCFKFLRSYCIDKLFDCGYYPLFSSNRYNTSAIFSIESTNFRSKHRWNVSLFRNEYFTHCLSSRVEVASVDERINLYEWLRDHPEIYQATTPFIIDCDLRKVRLTQRWKHPWS